MLGRLRSAVVHARRRVLARSGPVARAVLYPNPWTSPSRARVAHIARDAGIGDVVLCTPGLRALKAANPGGRVIFYTKFPELVRGLPYIDEVLPFEDRPDGTPYMEYTKVVPSPAHIAQLLGDRMGVRVIDTRPDCVVDPAAVTAYRAAWAHLPRPWVVVVRRASRFTPNKDWPMAAWDRLVTELCGWAGVIEIGSREDEIVPPPTNHLDLRGATTTAGMVAALAAADIHAGPVSGPLHIAAALRTPSVVVIGGYEHPDNTHYDGNIEFYTQVACAPCWLRTPCPFDIACLRAIQAADVAAAIRTVWAGMQANTARSDATDHPAEAAQPA